MKQQYLIALDQGTTTSRAIIFNAAGEIVSQAQYAFTQHYPHPGWVEHDAEEIFATQAKALAKAFAASGLQATDIAGIGITNQRETVVVWDKKTAKPLCNAIVWQCRRTAEMCDQIDQAGMADYIATTTGLVLDAYFSATKIQWILDNITGAAAAAKDGQLRCGTIDSWLIYRLSGGKEHITDYTNASRTMLFDIHRLAWDEVLLKEFKIPDHMLPRPVKNNGHLATVATDIKGLEALAGIPILSCIGDQPSALFGQACFEAGEVKNTYGTGCFTLMNTAENPVKSTHNLLTSIAWVLDDQVTYALEGSVFNAGSAIQWLRDELGIIASARECDTLAERVIDNGGVYFVPAFTGLGAPHWDMYARGTISGLTRGSNKCHLARATLEAIAYQTADLLGAFEADFGQPVREIRVDGGASVSDVMMQFQADLLRKDINRPLITETTALGAAYLAGLSAGLYTSLEDIARTRSTERIFTPNDNAERMQAYYNEWHSAVARAKGYYSI